MTSVGFEPTISADERPQTYALDRAATGTGIKAWQWPINFTSQSSHFLYNTPSHVYHMTTGSDLLSEMNFRDYEITL